MAWVPKPSMNGVLAACLVVDSNTDDFDGVFYRAVKSSEGERKADSPEVVMVIPHILTVLCKSCAPWDTGGETSPS